MKHALETLIKTEDANAYMLNAGSEDLFGMVGVKPRGNDSDEEERNIQGIVAVMASNMTGIPSHITHSQETLAHYLGSDLDVTLSTQIGHRLNRELSPCVFTLTHEDLLNALPSELDYTTLYYIWVTWPEGRAHAGRVTVIPVHEALKQALNGRLPYHGRANVHAFHNV